MSISISGGINVGGTSGGATINNQDKTFTTNGEFTADAGYTGLGTVTVDVEGGMTTEELTVTPTTTTTTYTPSEADAYSKVTVSGVTNSIDANISASNIKSGVSILGVTGNVVELNGETKTVTPTTSSQTITPTSPKNGLTSVTVEAVTNTIDNNITAGNIKNGVSILGVTGNVVELNGETKTVTPTTSEQTIAPTSPKNGLTSVTVEAVTNTIDANITAGNIKKDVQILGVTGTYEGGGGSSFPPLPTSMAGLTFWIDGDCNTVDGVDRSVAQMEDLMFPNAEANNSTGNRQSFTNKTNSWSSNMLNLNDGYAFYPQQQIYGSKPFTIELVVQITSAWTGSPKDVIHFGSSASGGVFFQMSPDKILYAFFKDTGGTDHTFFPGSFAVNDIIYCYLVHTSGSITIAYPGTNASSTLSVNPKTISSAFNVGLNTAVSTGTTATASNGNIAIGMCRFWRRALSSAELTACYNDAKTRFNCL